MDSPFELSPLIQKIAGEVAATPTRRRSFSRPTEICLEEWWLSKPEGCKGLAVSGRPTEERKCNDAHQKFHSAPAKRRFASREFHSAEIVKKHGCTILETADGIFVSLSGFIDRSRTQQNGFSFEVCRDFIYGFPNGWKDYATSMAMGDETSEVNRIELNESVLSAVETSEVSRIELSECAMPAAETSEVNLIELSECSLLAAIEACNGAQLHELVWSIPDTERDVFNKIVYDKLIEVLTAQPKDVTEDQPLYDKLIEVLTPQPMDVTEDQPSKSTSSQVDADVLESSLRGQMQARSGKVMPHHTRTLPLRRSPGKRSYYDEEDCQFELFMQKSRVKKKSMLLSLKQEASINLRKPLY
ncbi:uncharacterized protein [Spinacia oleracea]|uniref:Uncharacterized protein isoform X1 n=1 Tax=Spinacia oleracea TaxID=3562 RepID=A0A9R0JXD4_SPIOL|nr:uncharacterized protein LOC110789584 isoform X1 [Spinacia oleracea]